MDVILPKKFFGTDGIRGRVGDDPITPEFFMRLGYSAGKVLISDGMYLTKDKRPAVLIGKDTRISGYMLESALQAGLSAAGVDVLLTGPMPTPGVGYLTCALRLQAGIVISASHNSFEDNGIKFFSSSGNKLSDKAEKNIEAGLSAPLISMPSTHLGKARRVNDAPGRYIEFCKSTFPYHLDLHGMRIVVDCGHGATYHIAGHVLHELGADVVLIGAEPDGLNINQECGATHSATIQQAVKKHKADFGIALDGDGDRLIMADNKGRLYDGDQLVCIIAKHRQNKDSLNGGVVGTLMTNLAIENYFKKLGIPFARAKVGDRFVLELLQKKGWELGGEGSGHIICLDKHSTGDGIISALQVLYAMKDTKKTLAELSRGVTLYPQQLINIKITERFDFLALKSVKAAQIKAENDLGSQGRVLLRASGTELLVRVMVEGESKQKVKRWAEYIANILRKEINL